MSALPHQSEVNMDHSPCSRAIDAFSVLLRHSYLQRRAPTTEQFTQSLPLESFSQVHSLSIRPLSVLSDRRIWTAIFSEAPTEVGSGSPALSRNLVWSEPVRSSIGRMLANGALSFWKRHSRVMSIRRGLYQQHQKARGSGRPPEGVLAHEPQPRHWFRVCGTSGYIS